MKTKKCYMIAISLCMLLLIASISVAFAACGGNASVDYYLSLESNGWRTYSSAKDIPEDLHFKADGNTYTLDIALSEGEQFTVNQIGTEEKIGHDQLLSTLENLSEGENGTIKVVHGGNFHFTYSPEDNALLYSFNSGEGQGTEPVSGVELDKTELSMELGDEVRLTATVLPENAQNKNVIWDSEDKEVVTVSQKGSNSLVGLVKAVGYGTTTITVTTAEKGFTAECTVTVERHASSIRFDPETLSLTADGKEKEIAIVFSPSDATSRAYALEVTEGSEHISVKDDESGIITVSGISEGKATIKASLKENPEISATCAVTVSAKGTVLVDMPQNLQVMIEESTELTVSLENGTIENVVWTVSNDVLGTVATVTGEGTTAKVTGVDFGTTVVTATVTAVGGETYTATCNVLVADEYYFIYGYGLGGGDWIWEPYVNDKDAAERNELLFTEQSRGIYTLTRYFTPENGFQIIFPKVNSYTKHDDTQPEGKQDVWNKNIPSQWVATSHYYWSTWSDKEYISNTTTYFCVNAPGVYTVTLDLTGTVAKVYIKIVSLDVAEVLLELTDGSYTLHGGEEATVSYTVSPDKADYTEEDVSFLLTSDYADYAKYLSCKLDFASGTLRLSAAAAPQSFTAVLHVTVRGIEQTLTFYVFAAGEEKTPATDIKFEQDRYEFNVNNGKGDWTTTVKANVNENATNKQVRYYDVTDYNELLTHAADERAIVNSVTGEVTARSLGTLKIKAVSLEDPSVTATVDVLFYSDQFYIVGDTYGYIGWTVFGQETTTTTGTAREQFTFMKESNAKYTYRLNVEYTGAQGGKLKIVFLGMNPDDWMGEINSSNAVRELGNAVWGEDFASAGSDNIVFSKTGEYDLTIDLSMHKPVLLVNRADDDSAPKDYVLDFKGGTKLKPGDTVTARLLTVPFESFGNDKVTVSYDNDGYLTDSYDETTNTLTFTVEKQDHAEDKTVTVSITVGTTTNTLTFTIIAEHHLELTWDEEGHYYQCTDEGCDYIEDVDGTPDSKTKHDVSEITWSSNAEGHFYGCSFDGCGYISGDITPHEYSLNNGVFDFSDGMKECSVCHFKLFEIEGNTLKAYYGDAATVKVPDYITIIGAHAFEGHAELKTLTYSANLLTEIGDYAFAGCTSLESFTIGNQVIKIGEHAFDGTAATITWNDLVKLTTLNRLAFYGYLGESVEIPNSVTKIEIECFSHCINLKSITIPDGVTMIGGYAFSYCTSLKTAIFGKSVNAKVTSIPVGAFNGCTALETVLIRGTKFWEFNSPFTDCMSIKAIYIERPLDQVLECDWMIPMLAEFNHSMGSAKGRIYIYSEKEPGPDPFGDAGNPDRGVYFRDWFGGCWHWDSKVNQNLNHIKMWPKAEKTAATSLDMPAILNDRKEYGLI